jgi:malonyl CoA-acyl carrier protein transacylase
MKVFVFPGQGSQKRGMGEGLFDSVSQFAQVEGEVDRLLGYSLRKLCLEDADNQLKETRFTQPALYVVNALHYFKAVADGNEPDAVAGHSLGEYDALLAAGAFDLLTGLRLVQKRGELMAQARGGGMAAVIGLTPEQIAATLQQNGLGSVDVANFNSPTQTVISGPVADTQRAKPVFEQAGARMYVPLQVSAAFHSRYMADAAKAFDSFLGGFTFAAPKIPVIANVTAEPYPSGDPSATIRSLLVRQITQSVQWTQSVRYLIARGAQTFEEMGPGNVLTKLIQQIQKASA